MKGGSRELSLVIRAPGLLWTHGAFSFSLRLLVWPRCCEVLWGQRLKI